MPTPSDSQNTSPESRTVVRIVQEGSWLRWLPIALALAIGAWLGYAWGARRLEATRAQLVAIEATERRVKQEYDATTAKLKDLAITSEREHQASIAKIEAGAAEDKRRLQADLDRTQSRLDGTQLKLRDSRAQFAAVHARIASAPSAEVAHLKEQEAEIGASVRRLELAAQGLQCLQVPVPAEEIAILNRPRSQR